jgi:hypothetical protein
MAVNLEYLNDSFPHRFASESLLNGHAFDMHGFNAM